ncbi:hypothetical protein ACFL1M_03675 [Patescibacteria group bacterium]
MKHMSTTTLKKAWPHVSKALSHHRITVRDRCCVGAMLKVFEYQISRDKSVDLAALVR